MKSQTRTKILKASLLVVSFTLLTGFVPKAGQRIELKSGRNVRSGADFRSQTDNVLFYAARGLKGEVTSVVKFKSGNYGVEMTVTEGTDTTKNNVKGKKVWVYYQASKEEGQPDPGSQYMAIKDAKGNVLNGSEIPEAKTVQTKKEVPVTKIASEESPKSPAPETATVPKPQPKKEKKPKEFGPPVPAAAPSTSASVTQGASEADCLQCHGHQSKSKSSNLEKIQQQSTDILNQVEVQSQQPTPTVVQAPQATPPRTEAKPTDQDKEDALAAARQAVEKPQGEVRTCIDFTKEPAIQAALASETPETRRKIHQMIWDHRDKLDPRLVYYRMVGESSGRAEARNTVGAVGLFQIEDKHRRDQLDALYAKFPRESKKYLQVKYYLKTYLPAFIADADRYAPRGCDRTKQWDQYTNFQKSVFLNYGDCHASVQEKERGHCRGQKSYEPVCHLAQDAYRGQTGTPLCDTGSNSSPTTRIAGTAE